MAENRKHGRADIGCDAENCAFNERGAACGAAGRAGIRPGASAEAVEP